MDDFVHLVDSGDCDAAKLTRSEVISFVPPGENLPWSAPGGKIKFYKIKYIENHHFLVGILWGVPQRVTPKERSIETIGLGLSPLGKICPRPLWTEKSNFLDTNTKKNITFWPWGSLGGFGRNRWESVGICRNRWELVGIGGNRWDSVGIGRNQWESVGIARNRQESAGIHSNQ